MAVAAVVGDYLVAVVENGRSSSSGALAGADAVGVVVVADIVEPAVDLISYLTHIGA